MFKVLNLDISCMTLKDIFKKLIKKKVVYKVDFDKYYKVISNTSGMSSSKIQQLIDDDNIVLYKGDWHHHDTFQFRMLCDKVKKGDYIKLNGVTYKAKKIGYGNVKNGTVISDSGENIYKNGTVEMMHCENNSGKRYILYLEKEN